MDKYIKTIDNQRHIKYQRDIIIRRDGKQIINPTVEMILNDGWEIYIEPTTEISGEEQILRAKSKMSVEIQQYDKSEEVERFFINNIPLWIDREERATLQRRFEIESKYGYTQTTLWKNNMEFILDIPSAMEMLDQLELYAIKCFDNTQYHLSNIEQLNNLNEIENYDYKVGYPEKLTLNI